MRTYILIFGAGEDEEVDNTTYIGEITIVAFILLSAAIDNALTRLVDIEADRRRHVMMAPDFSGLMVDLNMKKGVDDKVAVTVTMI